MRLKLDFFKKIGKGNFVKLAISVLLAYQGNIVNLYSQIFLPISPKTNYNLISTISACYQSVSIVDP